MRLSTSNMAGELKWLTYWVIASRTGNERRRASWTVVWVKVFGGRGIAGNLASSAS
jgi:hypothetical protein